MKRIFNLFALSLVFATFVLSCTNAMFGPSQKKYYLYQHRGGEEPGSEEIVIPDDDPLNGIEDATDPSKDPFKVGEWNDINYQFDGTIIDKWFFHVDFDGNTVPTYRFKEHCSGHGEWKLANEEKAEYTSTSPDGENTAQGYKITELTVSRYNGKNPLYKGTASINKAGGRMERFRFYRIKGKSVIVGLDQHLIAIDTYSKFVFAYGKITKTSSTAGKLVPMAFEPLDVHVCPAGQTAGAKLPFYMYDPLGFVNSDGSVVLYQEYRTEMGDATTGQTKYFPQVHDMERPIAQRGDLNTPGRSPYFSTDGSFEAELIDPLLDAVSSMQFQTRKMINIFYEKSTGGQDKVFDYGNILDTWAFDSTGKQLQFLQYTTEGNIVNASTPQVWTYKEGQYTKEKETSDDGLRIYENGSATMSVKVQDGKLWKQEATAISLGEQNYRDPGMHFLLRVRGATFRNDSLSYTFSALGGKVTMQGNSHGYDGDYWFDKNMLSDKWTSQSDNIAFYNGGPGEYTPLELKNADFEIRSKMKVSNFDNVAYRVASGVNETDSALATFLSQFAGKTFKMRLKEQWFNVGQIYGWKVKSYAFSGDGRTLTLTTVDGSDYTEKTQLKTYTYKTGSLNNGMGTYTSNGESLTVSLSGNNLMSGSTVIGTMGYSDPGPHWLVRVAGYTFEVGETRYVFSEDGTTLDLTWKGLAYVVVPTLKSEKREWQGSLDDTVETKYGGVWNRLQDAEGGKTGDVLAKPGSNGWIKTKQTAQGWAGATWEYAAPRVGKN